MDWHYVEYKFLAWDEQAHWLVTQGLAAWNMQLCLWSDS